MAEEKKNGEKPKKSVISFIKENPVKSAATVILVATGLYTYFHWYLGGRNKK